MGDAETTTSTESPVNWVAQYVAACSEVLNSANACLEVANVAVAARSKAAERPPARDLDPQLYQYGRKQGA